MRPNRPRLPCVLTASSEYPPAGAHPTAALDPLADLAAGSSWDPSIGPRGIACTNRSTPGRERLCFLRMIASPPPMHSLSLSPAPTSAHLYRRYRWPVWRYECRQDPIWRYRRGKQGFELKSRCWSLPPSKLARLCYASRIKVTCKSTNCLSSTSRTKFIDNEDGREYQICAVLTILRRNLTQDCATAANDTPQGDDLNHVHVQCSAGQNAHRWDAVTYGRALRHDPPSHKNSLQLPLSADSNNDRANHPHTDEHRNENRV